MHYCGLDVSSKSTHVYIENEKGRRVKQTAVATTPEGLLGVLEPFVERGLRVAVEAGNQTGWIYDLLMELTAKVHVVHPQKVKWIAESKQKSDRVDARLLAHLLRIGGLPTPVHMPSRPNREVRTLLRARSQLVRVRTQLINGIRGVLRQQRVTLKPRALGSRKGWRQVRELAPPGVAADLVATYEPLVAALGQGIAGLEATLQRRTKSNAHVQRLQSIAGVGPVVAQTVAATVDRVERFKGPKALVSYAGLAPTVRASGARVHYGPITKQGRSELRAVLVQAAHCVARSRTAATAPLRGWYDRIVRRRGQRTAIVALARKLLTIAYCVMRDRSTYDPDRLRSAA